MNCPKCETASLKPAQVKGVEVDQCTTCRGIWFDARELEQLLQLSRKELKPLRSGSTDEARDLKRGVCPRDTTDLLRVYNPQQGSLVLDTCPQCNGTWLDGGEFRRLASG